MKNTQLVSKLGRSFNKIGFQLKKHSPEILVVAGIGGVIVSAVTACKATLKVDEVVEEHKKKVEKVHEATEHGCTEAGADYSVEDSKKDLTTIYIQTGIKFAKLYAPSVALGALSIAGIVGSNRILRKRNVALAAAYATIDKSFKEYRGRVVERFGENVERELRYNIKALDVEETVVDEKGKEKTVKKTVDVVDQDVCSDYARIFNRNSRNFDKDPELNKMFLKAQEHYANDLLIAKGYLFLNDVYDSLDLPRTKAGQMVGWMYDPKNPVGDNYVDFGIKEANTVDEDGHVEHAFLLDFNVDGNIVNNF